MSAPLPPGSSGLPWIGETPAMVRDSFAFGAKRRAQHGDIYRSHLLGQPTIVMAGFPHVEWMLGPGRRHFGWGAGWPATFKELLGRSLFVQDGAEHKQKRRLLAGAFSRRAVAGYMPAMQTRIRAHLDRWAAHAGGAPVTLGPLFKALTFELASDLFLGTELDDADLTARLAADFNALTAGFFALPLRWSWTTYGRALAARDRLLSHVRQVVQQRRRAPTDDALSRLIEGVDEDGERLSDDELVVQALLLLFAGHDTTTSFLTHFARALAEHPDVLARCRAELAALPADPSAAQLAALPYLDQVLQEVERMYPPVAGGFRGVVEEVEHAGYRFPQGWRVLYRIWDTQHDPRVFDEPEQFRPERWAPGHSLPRLIGFGGGPRICLGKSFALTEIKLVAAELLRRFDWEPVEGQDLRLSSIPILRTKSGYIVRLRAA